MRLYTEILLRVETGFALAEHDALYVYVLLITAENDLLVEERFTRSDAVLVRAASSKSNSLDVDSGRLD